MSKKAKNNNSKNVSDELIEKLIKIDNNNIPELFKSKCIFIFLNQIGTKSSGFKYSIINQFTIRPIFIKDKFTTYVHLIEGEVRQSNVKIFTSELKEDYDIYISDIKRLIKNGISESNIYALKYE